MYVDHSVSWLIRIRVSADACKKVESHNSQEYKTVARTQKNCILRVSAQFRSYHRFLLPD